MDIIASEEKKTRIAEEVAGGEPVWRMPPVGLGFAKRCSRVGIRVRPTKIFPNIPVEQLFWMASAIWTGI